MTARMSAISCKPLREAGDSGAGDFRSFFAATQQYQDAGCGTQPVPKKVQDYSSRKAAIASITRSLKRP